jgi:hypothetical protein
MVMEEAKKQPHPTSPSLQATKTSRSHHMAVNCKINPKTKPAIQAGFA